MKVHQLKDPVYTSNVYLIESEKPILIDTGGGLFDDIVRQAEQHLQHSPLHAIIFTHGHPDHIGDAKTLAKHFDVPLFIHADEQEKLPEAQLLESVFDAGDAQFQIIHTPGHSPGGVSLYEPEKKMLFSGDCVFPGGRTGRWDLPGSDYDALCDSVKRLSQLDIQTLYPGHYNPVTENVARHLTESLKTLEVAGADFDEDKYDDRIALLSSSVFSK